MSRNVYGRLRRDRVVDEGALDEPHFYRMAFPRNWSRRVTIPVDTTVKFQLPDGFIRRGRLFVSAPTGSGSLPAGLTSLNLLGRFYPSDFPFDLLAIAGDCRAAG